MGAHEEEKGRKPLSVCMELVLDAGLEGLGTAKDDPATELRNFGHCLHDKDPRSPFWPRFWV